MIAVYNYISTKTNQEGYILDDDKPPSTQSGVPRGRGHPRRPLRILRMEISEG